MANAGEMILNSVLCFINSAKEDHTNDSLIETANAFFSHEDIKSAKTELSNLLHRDILWRRDPDKKRKDMKDVVDLHNDIVKSRLKVKFVTDSYRKMPPVGMEMIAPLLVNLSEEVTKINEVLPKILDIKTEVTNCADTVRQVRIDVNEMRANFTDAVKGLNSATNDVVENDLSVLEDLRSFRRSIGGIGAFLEGGDEGQDPSLQNDVEDASSGSGHESGSYRDAVSRNQVDGGRPPVEEAQASSVADDAPQDLNTQEFVTPSLASAISGPAVGNSGRLFMEGGQLAGVSGVDRFGGIAWSVAGERERLRRQQRKENKNAKQMTTSRVTGIKKSSHNFKGIKRTSDVFIGRVDCEVQSDDVGCYIKDNFGIEVNSINELEIKTDRYKAFKVNVALQDREKLFESDKWPENIIVDKFFNRSK